MLKSKVFNCYVHELQQEINDWFKENPDIKIISQSQTQTVVMVCLVLIYSGR